MNLRQKFSLVFLILGLLLSSVIRVKFNIANGFEFHNLWLTWIPAFFDFALISSSEQALTTTFLGYACFITFGFLMLPQIKALGGQNKSLIIFFGLTGFALLYELISLAQDLLTSYYGQYLRMGLILFLLGLLVFTNSYKKTRNHIKMHIN